MRSLSETHDDAVLCLCWSRDELDVLLFAGTSKACEFYLILPPYPQLTGDMSEIGVPTSQASLRDTLKSFSMACIDARRHRLLQIFGQDTYAVSLRADKATVVAGIPHEGR